MRHAPTPVLGKLLEQNGTRGWDPRLVRRVRGSGYVNGNKSRRVFGPYRLQVKALHSHHAVKNLYPSYPSFVGRRWIQSMKIVKIWERESEVLGLRRYWSIVTSRKHATMANGSSAKSVKRCWLYNVFSGAKNHKDTLQHKRNADKKCLSITKFFGTVKTEEKSNATGSVAPVPKQCPGIYNPKKSNRLLKLMMMYGE